MIVASRLIFMLAFLLLVVFAMEGMFITESTSAQEITGLGKRTYWYLWGAFGLATISGILAAIHKLTQKKSTAT